MHSRRHVCSIHQGGGPNITPRLEVSPPRPKVPGGHAEGPGRETHGRALSWGTCWAGRPQRQEGRPPTTDVPFNWCPFYFVDSSLCYVNAF